MIGPTLAELKTPTAAMKRIDRLGWPVGFSLTAYGVRIGVRTNEPDVLPQIKEVITGRWKASELNKVDRLYSLFYAGSNGNSSRRFNHLYGDDARLSRSRDLETVLQAFDSDYRMFVAEFAANYVFVHAGAVGWKGKAIVIPGRSFSGKSTLVAELVRAGATYYSDEYAVIDSRGLLHPFAKPLELREKGGYTQTKFNMTEFGGQVGTKPLPIAVVLMTKFTEGARWRPRRLTSGKGVLQLLSNTVSARRYPQKAFEHLERVAAQAQVLHGVRGQSSDMVPALIKRLEKIRATSETG